MWAHTNRSDSHVIANSREEPKGLTPIPWIGRDCPGSCPLRWLGAPLPFRCPCWLSATSRGSEGHPELSASSLWKVSVRTAENWAQRVSAAGVGKPNWSPRLPLGQGALSFYSPEPVPPNPHVCFRRVTVTRVGDRQWSHWGELTGRWGHLANRVGVYLGTLFRGQTPCGLSQACYLVNTFAGSAFCNQILQETQVWSPGWENSLEKGNGSPLRYSYLGNPKGLQRIGHNLVTKQLFSLLKVFH